MGFPELYHDESVILQAQNIKVKSVVFEAVLTNKRLILVDSKKGLIPTQEILIATIDTVAGGENAIRDPILTFSIFSPGGIARQMILTFPREARGERRRERDEWLKAINTQILSSDNSTIFPDSVPEKTEPEEQPVQSPAAPAHTGSFGASPQRKKIDIARPRRNIIETVPTIPRPVETSSLPLGSFCSRCGNRVPPDSVFCNRCGTAVAGSMEQPAVPPAPAGISTTPVAAPPAVPQVQLPTIPVFGAGGDRKERTLEEVIHSIEPLIEDSVPRSSELAPLVPRQYPAPPPLAETPEAPSPAVNAPLAEPATLPSGEPGPAAEVPSTASPPSEPIPPAPALPPRKSNVGTIVVLAIVILAAIAGIVLVSNLGGIQQQNTLVTPEMTPVPTVTLVTPTPVPTPVQTPEVTAVPTEQPSIIPQSGVWVRVTYLGKFDGTFGTPTSKHIVGERNTGDQFFSVATITGPVEASIQKLDGSNGELVIEVYKNGELMKRVSTVAPKGIIDLQVDLKPKTTTTPAPPVTTIAPAGNTSPVSP